MDTNEKEAYLKHLAHKAVRHAVMAGEIPPPSEVLCEVGIDCLGLHGWHHDSYDPWNFLNVRCLCARHHAIWHGQKSASGARTRSLGRPANGGPINLRVYEIRRRNSVHGRIEYVGQLPFVCEDIKGEICSRMKVTDFREVSRDHLPRRRVEDLCAKNCRGITKREAECIAAILGVAFDDLVTPMEIDE